MAQSTLQHIHHARAILAESAEDRVVLTIPGTDYQIHLLVYQRPSTPIGKRIIGTIRAAARRVDVVRTGGRYVEPVYGRPRRIQGEIIAIDGADNSITVDAGMPIVCKVGDARQRADQFKVGDFVSFDALPGSSFTPHIGE